MVVVNKQCITTAAANATSAVSVSLAVRFIDKWLKCEVRIPICEGSCCAMDNEPTRVVWL